METLVSFLIAALVTAFFMRRYLKGLAHAHAGAPAPPAEASPCPRCGQPAHAGGSFCPHCGAPLSLWNVHRAPLEAAQDGAAKGKPRPVINTSLCIGCGSCVAACPETGTLAMAAGKAILAHPERCAGHAKCVEVCPTQGVTLSYGGVLQTMRVPLVKENFETNVPGLYIIGELGGGGLIKTSINEGRLAIDYIRERLSQAGAAAPDTYDVLIVGSGPAGLSASLTAHQHGLKYLTLEQGEIATTIRNYPRHKLVFAEPIEMPLYGNLYMADSSKEGLLSIWETIIANTGVHIQTQTCVQSVRQENGVFRVGTTQGDYRARAVVLAIGKRGTPRKLGVPGEGLGKVAYRLIEAESYRDADILVVGGGDSALECALALSKAARNRVTLSYRGAVFNRVRDRNRELLEKAETSHMLRTSRQSTVLEIRDRTVVLNENGVTSEIPNDFVFVLIGGESPEEFVRKIGVEIVVKSLAIS